MQSDIRQQLNQYRAERDELLTQAQTLVEQDARVCAAWLFGSLGRGNADDLSDIDLFVIVHDEDFEALIADRYAYMGRLADPILLLEAPQNWPPGGVYNMALYGGAAGPHQVDWYWVRRSAAQIPTEIELWFDYVGLPRLDSPTHFSYAPVPERTAAEVASQAVNMFWVMLLITAKYIARAPEEAQGLLPSVEQAYQQVATFTATSSVLPSPAAAPQPSELVDLLRQWAALMEEIMPAVVANGGYIPARFPPYAYRYLDLIAAVITALPKGVGA